MSRNVKKPTVQDVLWLDAIAKHLKIKSRYEDPTFTPDVNAIRQIGNNLSAIATEALKSALLSRDQGKIIQTDDGTQWQHDLDLSQITSVCHRRVASKIQFAVIECLPLKSGEITTAFTGSFNEAN